MRSYLIYSVYHFDPQFNKSLRHTKFPIHGLRISCSQINRYSITAFSLKFDRETNPFLSSRRRDFARKEGRKAGLAKKKKKDGMHLAFQPPNQLRSNTRETRLGAEKAAREWWRLIASAATKWRANVFLLSQLNRVPL